MISLTGYKKFYNKSLILEIKNLKFNKTGFYLICGRSGCGKTTLLNSLSLLDEDFKGNYYINCSLIDKEKPKNTGKVRKENISYIYQKPVLLNDFTCIDNIQLFSSFSKERILYSLSEVGLRDKKDQKVCTLSGGEKQRLALAKAVALEKPIILADEPTGSLDKENALFVLEKLKRLSKTKLVIVVSHDVDTFKQYSDFIIKISKRGIEEIPKFDEKLCKSRLFFKNDDLNLKILKKKYSKNIIKKKRFKNFLVSFFIGLSLICLSMTLIIGLNIKTNLMNGFSKFYAPNEMVIQSKENREINKRNSPSYDEILKINNILNPKENYRVMYSNNFETFFKDGNSLHLISKYKTSKIEGFSARSFNEFRINNTADSKYFIKKELNTDEIIISMDNQLMLQFCKDLQIKRDYDSLFNYIKNHKTYVSLFISNFDWQYEDEQLFRVVGFVIETDNFVYHSNPLFARDLFENLMKLPATNYDEAMDKPWYLKRNFIIKCTSPNAFYENNFLSSFFIEKLNANRFSLTYDKYETNFDNKYLVFKKNKKDIFNEQHTNWLNNQQIKYQFSNTYYIKNNIVGGFLNELFFVNNVADLGYFEDNYFKNEDIGEIRVDKNINFISGGIFVNSTNKVTFKYNDKNFSSGKDLVVSEGFLNLLKQSDNQKEVYMIGLKEKQQKDNKIIKTYKKAKFNIQNIIKEQDPYIYVDRYGILNFFRDIFEQEYEKYVGNAVFLEVNDEKTEDLVNKFFYKHDVSTPFKTINKQVNNIINILESILGCFSLVIVIISMFLITLIIKSLILDFREDLYVLYCNGLTKKEISKIFNGYLFKIALKSSLFMIFFNVILNFLIVEIIENLMHIPIGFTFYYQPILITLILSIIMYFFSIFNVKKFIYSTDISKSIRN